jgi:transcription factor E2F4/5
LEVTVVLRSPGPLTSSGQAAAASTPRAGSDGLFPLPLHADLLLPPEDDDEASHLEGEEHGEPVVLPSDLGQQPQPQEQPAVNLAAVLDSSSFLDDSTAGSSRSSKSLLRITAKFVEVLQNSPNGELDLKSAATQLDMKQRRRMYDITNVLEGIGLVEKTQKNVIRWW